MSRKLFCGPEVCEIEATSRGVRMRFKDCGSMTVTPSTISTGADSKRKSFNSPDSSVTGLPRALAMRVSTGQASAKVLMTFKAANRSEAYALSFKSF